MQSPDLALELRASRPLASPELRERVRAVAAEVPAPRRRLALPPLRRVALVAAAVALAVGFGVAAIHGITHSGRKAERLGPVVATRQLPETGGGTARGVHTDALRTAKGLPYTPSRLQQYGASLRVQVNDREALSDATKRAMRVARLLGGYVAQARYAAPSHGRGSAFIVVRVPVDRVQDAVDEFSGLGTLLSQRVAITDVTKAVQEQTKEIARLRAQIARLEVGGVTPAERPLLEAAKARLDFLTKRKRATVRRAQLAKISLTLTTKPKAKGAAAGRFHRTLSDAGGVLVREAEILLYALIVAGPLLLLGAAAIGGARLSQRRRDTQLLERT
jgi:uncharacterized protein DUF4349